MHQNRTPKLQDVLSVIQGGFSPFPCMIWAVSVSGEWKEPVPAPPWHKILNPTVCRLIHVFYGSPDESQRSFRQILNSNSIPSKQEFRPLVYQLLNNPKHHSDCPEWLFEAPTLFLSQSSAEMSLMGSNSPDLFYSTCSLGFSSEPTCYCKGKKMNINHLEIVPFCLEGETGVTSIRTVEGERHKALTSSLPQKPVPCQQLDHRVYRWTPVNTPEGQINQSSHYLCSIQSSQRK